MELIDILALVKAGYTRDEIAQMDTQKAVQPIAEPVPVVETPQTAEPVAVPTQTPVIEPVATPVPSSISANKPEEPSMADLMQSIAKLTSAVQANAIAQSVIPQGLSNPPSAEDMLAEIIRPTFKERM